MTYKAHLERLLGIVAQKSDVYLRTNCELGFRSKRQAQPNADRLQKCRDEWEAAERAYADLLIYMKSNQIDPNEIKVENPELFHMER